MASAGGCDHRPLRRTVKEIGPLMTTEEVAAHYRTTPSTVRYWRATGYGPPGRRVGRRVLYERAAVESYWADLQSQDTQ